MLILKKRYIFTRHNKLRLRYTASIAALSLAAFLITKPYSSLAHSSARWDLPKLNVATNLPQWQLPQLQMPKLALKVPSLPKVPRFEALESENETLIVEPTLALQQGAEQELPLAGDLVPDMLKNVKVALSEKIEPLTPLKRPDIASAAQALKKSNAPQKLELTLKAGGTLSEMLQDANVSLKDAILSIRAMHDHVDPRTIKAGQVFSVTTRRDDEGALILSNLILPLSAAKSILVQRNDAGDYVAELQEKDIFIKNYAAHVTIDTSLYASAARVGVPAQIIAELIRVYSWDLDFQRDIRSGDQLKVMYSVKRTEDDEFAGYGDVQFASLSVGGEPRPIYRYEMQDGTVDYFDPSGRSIRKALMKTPVDGARLSSGFGMRMHPILGYNKMHKGVDFAAPTGTPIYAAGDGKVEYVGRRGAYGNYIRLRHNSTLKTAYAHLHKYAKNLNAGTRVKQGDVIGYIGSTGRSTGPHLHYEVLLNDTQVNPNRVDLPVGEKLKGTELARFKAILSAQDQEYALLSGDTQRVASSVSPDVLINVSQ